MDIWKLAVKASNSFNYDPILRYLRSQDSLTVVEGKVKLGHNNVINRKLYIGKHRTDPKSDGEFDIIYESETIIKPSDYRLLEFNNVNYHCIVTDVTYFHQTASGTLLLYILLPLRGEDAHIGIDMMIGLFTAVDELNENNFLGLLILPLFFDISNYESFIYTINTIIGTKDNIILIGGATSKTRDDVSTVISNANILFFYPGFTVSKEFYDNIFSTGILANQIVDACIHSVQAITTNILVIYSKLDSLHEKTKIGKDYLVPAFRSIGISMKAEFEYSDEFDVSIIKEKMNGGIIISLLEDENVELFMKIYGVLSPPSYYVLVLFPTTSLYKLETKYTNQHYVISPYFHQIDGVNVPSTLITFQASIKDRFNVEITTYIAESMYSAVYMIANAYLASSENLVSLIRNFLFEISYIGPIGQVDFKENGFLGRRIFTSQFMENGRLSLIRAPRSEYKPILNPSYHSESKIQKGVKLDEKIKYILIIHEYFEETVSKESLISSILQYSVDKFNSNYLLNGYTLELKHLFFKIEDLESQFILYPDPVLVIGCTYTSCRDKVMNYYIPRDIIFFYLGLDDGKLCNINVFFIITELKQRYEKALEYLKNTNYPNIIVLYSQDE